MRLFGSRQSQRAESDEDGAVAVMVALSMVVFLGMMALVVDVGFTFWVRSELQTAADSAALGAATRLPDSGAAETRGTFLALANHSELDAGSVDVVTGTWDPASETFTTGGANNAVQVTVHRSTARGNPVVHSFASVLGRDTVDVDATAVAVRVGSGSTRFLIDDEAFDTDIPALEDLADSLGVDTDELLSDTDGDKYIQLSNLAAGTIIELPTGQVGDEGLFDINPGGCTFPFPGGGWTFQDFIFHEVFSEILPDELMDPLLCVAPVDNPAEYPNFVDPSVVQVSPLYKSDVSTLDPVGGVPAVNAKGERRGLVAFRIIGIGDDPDGPGGSVLPNLIFLIEGPQSASSLGIGSSGRVKLVQ